MFSVSFLLLLGAAIVVAIMHSLLPDHWIPLAVVARTQRWTISQVMRVTFLASFGHVFVSLVLAGCVAIIGLQFQKEIDAQQGHIVGAVLLFTGIILLFLGAIGLGSHRHSHSHHSHHHHDHSHALHDHHHDHHHHDHSHAFHDHHHDGTSHGQPFVRRLAAIAIPFGVAASPDLTILPIALAASTLGTIAVISVLSMFTLMTIATFVSLTVIATLAGYRIKGDWLEKHASTITSILLIGLGIITFVGF